MVPQGSAASAELLRAAGVKVTRGRVRVFETLASARQPLSHAEIESAPDMLDDPVDRVTLYRILDTLVACGLALKAVDTRGVFRFSATTTRRQHSNHVHFRCTGCGGVFCLKAEPPPPPRLPRGFKLREVAFDLTGTCAGCSVRQMS